MHGSRALALDPPFLYKVTDESIIRPRLLVLPAGAIENKVLVGAGDLG